MHMHMHMHMHMYMYMYMHMYMHMFVYMHMYMYVYMHMYGLDAELVQLDAVGGQLGEVLAARREDEHEQREQHGDAGRVDKEDELLLEQRVELRLGNLPRQTSSEEVVVVVGAVIFREGNLHNLDVMNLELAEERHAAVGDTQRADRDAEVSRVEVGKLVDDLNDLEPRLVARLG